jgi:predicted enzyme related to lactoylglutathione lyase
MRGKWMKIGEVCLLTSDVIRLSNFYKLLFDVDNDSNDHVHQMILSEETTLTIYNDGIVRNENPHNICIAFTVDDVDMEFERIKAFGLEIVEPPAIRPWGAPLRDKLF